MTADPKPDPRVVDRAALPLDPSPATRAIVGAAFGECPLCEQGRVRLSRAHVVPKGQRGDDVPENLAWICGDGVGGCHGMLTHGNQVAGHPLTPAETRAAFVEYCRRTVPQLGAYADRKKHAGWLESYYDEEAR